MAGYKRIKFERPAETESFYLETSRDGTNWVKFKTRLGPKVEFEGTKVCFHNWVTTIGFFSEYIDCAICGIKKEESI